MMGPYSTTYLNRLQIKAKKKKKKSWLPQQCWKQGVLHEYSSQSDNGNEKTDIHNAPLLF